MADGLAGVSLLLSGTRWDLPLKMTARAFVGSDRTAGREGGRDVVGYSI
jgi:hypothetical protein